MNGAIKKELSKKKKKQQEKNGKGDESENSYRRS